MSRRDTIIIAVLVNAALLMVLFATAMRSDTSKGDKTKEAVLAQTSPSLPTPTTRPSHDELLNEFVASVPTFAESAAENILTFEETELVLTPSPPVPLSKPSLPPSQTPAEIKRSPPQAGEHYVNVTVKKGDFLEKIARGNNTTVAAIMKVNNMSSTQLKVGQVLKVPVSEEGHPEKKGLFSPQNEEYYTVREGDNPWLIASRNRINLEELLRLNDLDEQKARRLRPGDKLRIR